MRSKLSAIYRCELNTYYTSEGSNRNHCDTKQRNTIYDTECDKDGYKKVRLTHVHLSTKEEKVEDS